MNTAEQELRDQLNELQKRVKELESRPVFVPQPYPVYWPYYGQPYYIPPPVPYWQPPYYYTTPVTFTVVAGCADAQTITITASCGDGIQVWTPPVGEPAV
jgi:hypothetical protein